MFRYLFYTHTVPVWIMFFNQNMKAHSFLGFFFLDFPACQDHTANFWLIVVLVSPLLPLVTFKVDKNVTMSSRESFVKKKNKIGSRVKTWFLYLALLEMNSLNIIQYIIHQVLKDILGGLSNGLLHWQYTMFISFPDNLLDSYGKIEKRKNRLI